MDARADLTAALRLDRGIRMRAAAEARRIPEGVVVRHPELYDVHYLNAVLIDADAAVADAAAVAVVAEALGDAAHRHVVCDDADAGERTAAGLAAEGWERGRVLYMAFRDDPEALGEDPRARRISAEELDDLLVAAVREQLPDLDARVGPAARLVAGQAAVRAGTEALCFGAGDGAGLQSTCTLLVHDGAAMVTEVQTLRCHRQRGLARAVVSAAVREAHVRGARLIALATDADDWPQLMYLRLGFAPLGRQVSVTLRRVTAADGRGRGRDGGRFSVRGGL